MAKERKGIKPKIKKKKKIVVEGRELGSGFKKVLLLLLLLLF